MKKVLMLCAVVAFALGCTKSGLEVSNNKSLKVSCSFDSYGSSENSAGFEKSKDSVSPEKSKDPVGPASSEKSKNPMGSRLTDTAFEVEDEIGIYVHTDLAVQNPPAGNHSSNMRYIFKEGDTWQSASSLSGELIQPAYNATGYYPYKGTITNPHAVAHSVESDQSTHAAMSRSDFARAVGALDNSDKEAPTLNFSGANSFKHLMSKLRVSAFIPTEVDGVAVVDIESIIIGGLKSDCTVNLADGVVTLNTSAVATDITPIVVTAGGAGEYSEWEAIVVPQSVAVGTDLVTITLNMTGGSTKELKYTVAEGEAFDKLTSGTRVTLTLGNSADLAFTEVSQLDLVDGLAKTGGKFSVKAPNGTTWSVASSQTWLTLSNNSSTGTGSAQEVTFALALNSTAKTRTANLTLSATINGKVESTTHTVTQNYYTMTTPSNPATATAGQQSIVVGAITSNQLWYLSSSSTGNWLKLATSATYSASNPIRFPAAAPDKHIGSLVSGQLYYQLDVNNSSAVRTSTVTFTPDDGTTTAKTVTQSAPVLTLSATTQTVETAITSATFQVKSSSNQLGVTYTPTKGSNATSIAPDVFQTVDIIGSYSKTITVAFAANTGSSTARTIVATITYKGGTVLTHTITQKADGPPSVTIGGLKWTTGNLVADGANGCKPGAPTDGGLYFQWGKLVGWSGGASGDGTGIASTSPALSAKVKPLGYTGSTGWVSTYNNQGSYTTINVATGWGDPCKHYLGGTWRTPTTQEQCTLVGKTGSAWVPWGTSGLKGKWSSNPKGGWFGPTFSSNPPPPTANIFIPASGYRDRSNGSFGSVGTLGYYWSSSVYNADLGYYLYIHESAGVYPQGNHSRSGGFPVRCVSS